MKIKLFSIGGSVKALAKGFNTEEDMYKELYLALCNDFRTSDNYETIEIDLGGQQMRQYAFYSSKSKGKLVVKNTPSLVQNALNASSFETVDFGDQDVSIGLSAFRGNSNLKTVIADNATFVSTTFYQAEGVVNVYVRGKTKGELGSGYPFGVTNSECVFHCKDGDYDINGNKL